MGYKYNCPNNTVEVRSIEEEKKEEKGDGFSGKYGHGDASLLHSLHPRKTTLELECSLSSLQLDSSQSALPQQQRQQQQQQQQQQQSALFVNPAVTNSVMSAVSGANQMMVAATAAAAHHYELSYGTTTAMPSLLATASPTLTITNPTIITTAISTNPVPLPAATHAHALVNINANNTVMASDNSTQQTPTVTAGLSALHQSQQQMQLQQLLQQQQKMIIFPQQQQQQQQLSIPPYIPPTPSTWVAQFPALTVQDRPLVPPIYNGINPNYPNAHLLHAHPPIFVVDNFLTPAECDFLIEAASDALGPAPVVGKGGGELSPSRTSSTCYLAREDLPEYLRKVCLLTGKPPEHCELPQVGRYLPSQQYLQHFDAFDVSNEDGRRFASNGGQRTVTVLVYLNDVPRGGATSFPNLNIEVQPRRGMALVFFPSTLDGLLDKMTLHAALPAVDVKYVSQVWIRQSNYVGQPSKRLAQPMGPGLQEMREVAQGVLLGQLQYQQQQYHHHQQQQQYQLHVAQQHMQQHLQQGQLQQHQHGFVQKMNS